MLDYANNDSSIVRLSRIELGHITPNIRFISFSIVWYLFRMFAA